MKDTKDKKKINDQDQVPLALTFDDVLIVPWYTEILPRSVLLDTIITPTLRLSIPFISAAMDCVTESKMAIAMAQEGGLGIIHKNMSIAQQVAEVRAVKKFESGILRDPVTVKPNMAISQLLKLIEQHHVSGFPVVEGEQLVGIVTRRDLRFIQPQQFNQPVSTIMTPRDKLITVLEGASRELILKLFDQHRIEKLPIVDQSFKLCGMITVRDMQKSQEKPLSTKDNKGSLCVGATIGCGVDSLERAHALVKAGVDILVIDTAHGHSLTVLSLIKAIKNDIVLRKAPLMAGNVVTAEGALALAEAGVDSIKVGIGPGSICTTRIISGAGMPQITALQQVSKALLKYKNKKIVTVISDGGIRYSGDITKAITAGAHAVMMGNLLAGTDEAPGEVELYQGLAYKYYRGMGSLSAMHQSLGSRERYFQTDINITDTEQLNINNSNNININKLVPEGVEGRVPYKGTLSNILYQLLGGLRSGMGYAGCKTIEQLRSEGRFVRVTRAGVREGHAHNISLVKEPPNYSDIKAED